MRILVTGANGYIGRRLVPHLREHGHEVVGSDLGVSGDGDYIKSDVRYYPDVAYAVSETKPDAVLNLAGEVGIDNGQQHGHAMYDVNVMGALNVARACARHGAKLVSFSTSDVFGRLFDTGDYMSEDTEIPVTAPKNTYAASKLAGEMVVMQEAWHGGLSACILRPFMVYGPGEPANAYRSAMVRFCAAALRGEPFTVHQGTERAWCHIEDFIEGVRLVTEKGIPGFVYHVGGDDYRSMEYLAEYICGVTGGSYTLAKDTSGVRCSRKRFSMKSTLALGYKPRTPLELGTDTVLEYLTSV